MTKTEIKRQIRENKRAINHLHGRRAQEFEYQTKMRGDYPEPGWDRSFWHAIHQHQEEIDALVLEHISHKKRRGYIEIIQVGPIEFQQARERLMWGV